MSHLIIVHDDEPAMLDLIADVLALAGHRVVGSTAALDPSSLVFRNGPDLFVIDIMLHERSGIEFVQALRAQGITAPCIALSASPLLTDLARESGLFAAVLDKPFDLGEFLAAVESCLGQDA